ncbi:MAG TPA: SgcJ/EcaC family oxidoreductase [Candidatus Limnocylindrales bacterium]|nr:SgcJ/EcaC family oxidoreductase [Candidatus Limnocylindrales bacterium]
MSVLKVYEELLSAWNRRDAKAYAALFADDAALVGFDGSQIAGAEVEAHLAGIFADHQTASYVWKVRETRRLGPDIELLRAIVGMVPPGQTEVNPATNAVQSLVTVEGRIALFQNTPAQYHGRPDLAEAHTAEIGEVIRNR